MKTRKFNILLCTAIIGLAIGSPSAASASTLASPATASAVATESVSTSTVASKIIATGSKYMGTPYQFGADPVQTASFDCSSFTYRAFIENGITLPRTSNQQLGLGASVPLAQAQPGDLLFFKDSADPTVAGHVGIYLGAMKMLHASVSKGVTVSDISTSYWMTRHMDTKRVIPRTYTVVSGDTLWKISMSQQRTIDELRTWNKLTSDALIPAQQLMVDNPNLLIRSLYTQATTYYVQPGDTLWIIYKKTGIAIEQLKAWNNLTNDYIYVGQRLVLEPPFSTYTVLPGDSLWVISQKLKVPINSIKQANLLVTDTLYINQTLKIPAIF